MFTYNNKYATDTQTLNRLVTYDKYSLVTVISLSQANRTKFFSCTMTAETTLKVIDGHQQWYCLLDHTSTLANTNCLSYIISDMITQRT